MIYCIANSNITASVDLTDNAVFKDLNDGWTDNRGMEVDLNKLWFDSDGMVDIYHKVPGGLTRGQVLHFNSHNIYFSVYIGHHEVYAFYPRSNITGYGYGDRFHDIEIYGTPTSEILRIKARAIYKGEHTGSFGEMAVCTGDAYIYYIVGKYGLAALMSMLTMFFGITLIALHFSSHKKKSVRANMMALGVSAIMLGFWTLQETLVLKLIFGGAGVFRALDYVLIMFVAYPTVVFIGSVTKVYRKSYEYFAFANTVIPIAAMFTLRIVFNVDLHNVSWIMHLSLLLGVSEIILMLTDNQFYCFEQGLKSEMGTFYIGAAFLLIGGVIDILVYRFDGQNKSDSGAFLRVGLVVFTVTMLVQVARWMSNEQKEVTRERFINGLLKYSMAGKSPEENLSNMMEYMGQELNASRTFILEANENGTFDNTYEWCRENMPAIKDKLTNIPLKGGLDDWFNSFEKKQIVRIDDFSKHIDVIKDDGLKEIMRVASVGNIIAGQLTIDETHIGCFGLQDVSRNNMNDIESLMELTAFFISVTLRQRNTQKLLRKYSYRDQMTGVMNRRALDEFEAEQLGSNRSYGVLMVDINGLKRMNDVQGHDAGDQLIRDVANALGEVYGKENVYRMGGDEFLTIGFTKTEAAFLQNKKTVELLLSAKKRSASMGYVFCEDGKRSFEAVKKEADTLMYKDKQLFYEMAGNNRRDPRR